MEKRASSRAVVWMVGLAVLGGREASAQVIGSLSWQTQPYCNVITVTVVQQGGSFQLVGSDNLCGAGTAAVTGTAVPAAGGVQFGLTVAQPNGRPAHLSATISLTGLSGPWVDAEGQTGTFAFGGSGGGSPRPAPGGAPRRQIVTYSGLTTSQAGTISPAAKLRDLGTFTSGGGPVRLTWTSHIMLLTAAGACNFQIRVDGQPDAPVQGIGLNGAEAVLSGSVTGQAVPAHVTVWFPTLAAGSHTIELWLRSVTSTCNENNGNYVRQVLVEEFGAP